MSIKRRLVEVIAFGAIMGCMAGCGTQEYLVNDPTLLLTYQKSPTPENLENLSKAYSTQINRNRKEGIVQPGLFCDYAVTLAKLGRMDEANQWFNQEMATFPNASSYVKKIQMSLSNEYSEMSGANGQAQWEENETIVDNPEDIEQMRSNKPREASELPNVQESDKDQQGMDKSEKSQHQSKAKHHSKKKGKKH